MNSGKQSTSHIRCSAAYTNSHTSVVNRDTQVGKSGPKPKSVAERFWPKVHRTPTCWLWTGSQGNTYGHGSISVRQADGKYLPEYAHRVSWELANGAIPDGLQVLHRCDVAACVNPDHLFLGTQDANLKDAAAKGRFNVPRPNHPRRKLSEADVAAIHELRRDGLTLEAIGANFGVTKCCISQIVRGLRRVYSAPQLQQPDVRRIA